MRSMASRIGAWYSKHLLMCCPPFHMPLYTPTQTVPPTHKQSHPHNPSHQVAHRTNVLLLGDSLGDLKMSHGMSHDVCLTVGFLNHDVDALLPKYKGAFDVVLLHDAPMTWVNELLQGLQ